jgi:hypothetical protein
MIEPAQIQVVVDQLQEVRDAVSTLLLYAPDISIKPEEFEKSLTEVVAKIRFMRETGQTIKELLDTMQSASQKSRSEP